ncbi:MAG: type II toxin-antitoxin system VapC family toxin [Candidatus Methylacidiphilales bacterium]
MRLFIDTDILLDVLLGREPHLSASGELLDWAEKHPGKAAVSWHGLANLHYMSEGGAEAFIRDLLSFCEVPSTGTMELHYALDLKYRDLEDAMQTAAAMKFQAQAIATRNVKDYRKSPIAVLTPTDLVLKLRDIR